MGRSSAIFATLLPWHVTKIDNFIFFYTFVKGREETAVVKRNNSYGFYACDHS